MIPEFAVVGHPNEGKSSVVSTLTEDDQIKISAVPGETVKSRVYTVQIDGKPVIRFVDTPGFQMPKQTLAWFRAYEGRPDRIVPDFITTYEKDPFFEDECELLRPLANGAGIIYVVDGSRPVRDDDLAEMEILRLTGLPRMALINSKDEKKDYTAQWQMEFRKQFNAIRVFNSNTAGFSDRLKMLENLKVIHQDWEDALTAVISAFLADWKKRNRLTAGLITNTLKSALSFQLSRPPGAGQAGSRPDEKMVQAYQKEIKKLEHTLFQKIRELFKHQVYEFSLPPHSILQDDLFSGKTWRVLGLNRKQLAAAGAVAGGTMGAVVDTAAAGITFGVFSAIGGILGAGSALWGASQLVSGPSGKFLGGGEKVQLGPAGNIQFLYVLLDRAVIYYSHMVNHPHGRRVPDTPDGTSKNMRQGYASRLSMEDKKCCDRFFRQVTGKPVLKKKDAGRDFQALVVQILDALSIPGENDLH